MALPKKNIFMFFFFFVTKCYKLELPYLYFKITSRQLVKVRWLRSVPKAMEKKIGWCTIFHELKSVAKAKIARNNSQFSEGGITVKPGQNTIPNSWIDYLKSESVCRFSNLYPVSNCIQMIGEFLTAIF